MTRRSKIAKASDLQKAAREARLQDKAIRLAHERPELRDVLVPVLKRAAMSESAFWKFIEPFGWGTKTTDYDAIEKAIMRRLTADQAEELSEAFHRLKGRLYKRVDDWQRDNDRHLGVGDDGFDDLLSHIVGLGKREYDAVMKDPELAYQRAQARYGSKDGFEESFSYAIPSAIDYKNLDVGKYRKWAKEVLEEYLEALGKDDNLIPYSREIRRLVDILEMMARGDYHEFAKHEKEGRDLAEGVQKALNRKDLQSPVDKWAVWNLFSDVQQYLL